MSWHEMPGRPGSHTVYARDEDLVAEWYDHGDDVPYESANLLVLRPAAQTNLCRAMAVAPPKSPDQLAALVASRFRSWFDFKTFVEGHGVEARRETDFWP